MGDAENSSPRIALIQGEAVIHQRYGGAGPSSRLKSARENAHAGLMRCTDTAGGPAPKCVEGAGADGVEHTKDCDHATGLLEQLRAMGFGSQPQQSE